MNRRRFDAEGRLRVPRLVAEVVRHCNLSCRGCNHFAPRGRSRFVDPDELARDLGLAARYVRARDLRISGGEPLLHPRLTEVVEAARASEISDTITVLTNGLLLDRMPDEVWHAVDQVRVSLYPASDGRVDLRLATERARETDTELLVCRPIFREAAADLPPADERLVRQIWLTCIFRRVCTMILDGRLYVCPQSAWAHERWPAPAGASPLNAEDGLLLEDRPDMASRIRTHLERREPLGSCSRCLGIVGHLIAEHTQLSAEQAGREGVRRVEDLLDEAELAARLRQFRRNRRFRFLPRAVRRAFGWLPTSRPLTADADPARAEQRLWPPSRRRRRLDPQAMD